jgi:hypothetical protein
LTAESPSHYGRDDGIWCSHGYRSHNEASPVAPPERFSFRESVIVRCGRCFHDAVKDSRWRTDPAKREGARESGKQSGRRYYSSSPSTARPNLIQTRSQESPLLLSSQRTVYLLLDIYGSWGCPQRSMSVLSDLPTLSAVLADDLITDLEWQVALTLLPQTPSPCVPFKPFL